MAISPGPCSLGIFAIKPLRAIGWSSSEARVNALGISVSTVTERWVSQMRTLCRPAPLGSWCGSKHRPTQLTKEEHRVLSSLAPDLHHSPLNFPKADGRLSSLRQESDPGRLIYFSPLLARENRPKAERGGTPYCKYTHATQTQLMPDFQTLTLLIRSLCYCVSDE